MKYSLMAKAYLAELDIKEPIIKHTMVTWGNFQMMEDLFVLYGRDRVKLMEKTGYAGYHYRFKFVMDKLDRESKKGNAIFEKGYICYNGLVNRPTRCFKLKE